MQWGDPADSSAIPQGDFDVVYDNNGKTLEACQPLIDNFKVRPVIPPRTCTGGASAIMQAGNRGGGRRLGAACGLSLRHAIAAHAVQGGG